MVKEEPLHDNDQRNIKQEPLTPLIAEFNEDSRPGESGITTAKLGYVLRSERSSSVPAHHSISIGLDIPISADQKIIANNQPQEAPQLRRRIRAASMSPRPTRNLVIKTLSAFRKFSDIVIQETLPQHLETEIEAIKDEPMLSSVVVKQEPYNQQAIDNNTQSNCKYNGLIPKKRKRQETENGKEDEVPGGNLKRTPKQWWAVEDERLGAEDEDHQANLDKYTADNNSHEGDLNILQAMVTNDPIAAYQTSSQHDTPIFMTRNKDDFIRQMTERFFQASPQSDIRRCTTTGKALKRMSQSYGFKQMGTSEGLWKLVGMNTGLYTHQMMGGAWMLKRECSKREIPNGGILADDMGVGKTIQTLTIITANLPTHEQKKKHVVATLIVVPKALRFQWHTEAKMHTKLRRVIMYDPRDLNKCKERLEDEDIVIATYNDLVASARTKDVLHQVTWYRIVIDESHHIKNPTAKLSKAMFVLKGNLRWALSGTPMPNGCEDFYSQMKFLKHPFTKNLSFTQFRTTFCNKEHEDHEKNIKKLSSLVSHITLRRTFEDKVMGEKIVNLKEPHRDTLWIKMCAPEKVVFDFIDQKFRDIKIMKERKQLAEDDPRQESGNQLRQILRRRQLVANPILVELEFMAIFNISELQELQAKLSRAAMGSSQRQRAFRDPMLTQISKWINRKKLEKKNPASKAVEKKQICLTCQHEEVTDLIYIPECKHVFCRDCHEQNLKVEIHDEIEVFLCQASNCKVEYDEFLPCKAQYQAHGNKPAKVRPARKAKDVCGFRPIINQEGPREWLNKFDDGKVDILPSAKLEAAANLVRRWRRDHAKDKIVVFTQWNLFAVMIGATLEQNKINFLYFSGDMTENQRKETVLRFKDDKNANVMIIMLKCGGYGLNLMFANRAIIVDLWWNIAVENQAFGRINRIGQTKETYVVKLAIEKTIDDLILEIQEEKHSKTSHVLQDKLTAEDRAKLLACVKDDNENIEPENEDEDDGKYDNENLDHSENEDEQMNDYNEASDEALYYPSETEDEDDD
ncbi:SNF2 family N-terminal domain-containing protein [Tricladium varicosporioides]|nr:SNF2 family N-terminal domain-containing protein [Hymenoscyphus varicosporioides]